MLAALPRCVVSSGIAVVLSYAVFLILDSRMDSARIPFLGALAVAVVVYFLLAYAFSIVSKDDISVISKR